MNPMLKNLTQSKISPIRDMMKMLRSSGNPQMMFNRIAAQNPQIRRVMEYINQNGGDAKTAFYKLAQEQGVNPDDILSQLQ